MTTTAPASDIRVGVIGVGQMGADHPIAWCHAVGAGQSFVTAMGHTDESWADPAFVAHVGAGVVSVVEPGSCG